MGRVQCSSQRTSDAKAKGLVLRRGLGGPPKTALSSTQTGELLCSRCKLSMSCALGNAVDMAKVKTTKKLLPMPSKRQERGPTIPPNLMGSAWLAQCTVDTLPPPQGGVFSDLIAIKTIADIENGNTFGGCGV